VINFAESCAVTLLTGADMAAVETGASAAAGGAGSVGSATPIALAGAWELNLKLSDPISPFLAEVGVPWLIRKLVDSLSVSG